MKEKKGILSFLNIDSIVDNLTGLVEKKVELFKIEFQEDAARAGAKIVVLLILGLSAFMALLFFSIALSVLIGNLLKSETIGFLIMGGFYTLILIVFIFLNKFFSINKSLEKSILEILSSDGKGDK